MRFLAPAFILGALAIGLPILFHLIRRTAREKMPFSSLMFLQAAPPRVTKRSRLENLFLLLLRCGVLGLLALGFARPYLQKPFLAGAQPVRQKKLVILLDTSASMRREDLWMQARAKAEELMRKCSATDKAALMTFDRQVRAVIDFEQWSAMAAGDRLPFARQRLAEITPGWSDTHLGAALIRGADLLEETRHEDLARPLTRQVALISDLQEGSRLEGLQGYEWPRGIELIIEPLKPKRPANAGLHLVAEREDADPASEELPPRVRVYNSTDSTRELFQVGWARPGEQGFWGAPIEVYVPPGQSRIVPAPKFPAAATPEQLVLKGDDPDFDNTVFFTPDTPAVAPVWYLGSESEKDAAQPLYYLQRAFQQTRRHTVQIVALGTNAPLNQTQLPEVQLIIVSEALPEDRLQIAQRFLNEGKMVFAALKDAGAAQTLGRLLGMENLAATEAPVRNYAMLGEIDFQHPIFAPFADPRFSDFTKIHFWKHRRWPAEKVAGARIVARFDDGDAALVQVRVQKGTLLVLTAGWQPGDSQLALSSKFVPLLYAILEQSGAVKPRLTQYHVGAAIDVQIESSNPAQFINVLKPDGSQVQIGPKDRFGQTDLPGIYLATAGSSSFRWAVNLAPDESRTVPLPIEELERLGLPLKQPPIVHPKEAELSQRHLQAAELEHQQKLWRWLLVAAFVVLMMESWLAGRLTRRILSQAEGRL